MMTQMSGARGLEIAVEIAEALHRARHDGYVEDARATEREDEPAGVSVRIEGRRYMLQIWEQHE